MCVLLIVRYLISSITNAIFTCFVWCIFARYERFLKIMILSVLKNTHRPVKFWFIKNYLSPPFKVKHFFFFYIGNSKQNLTRLLDIIELLWSSYVHTGSYSPHVPRVWFRIWTNHIQMAYLVAQAERKAANNLGI